jgi:hypothetical protein
VLGLLLLLLLLLLFLFVVKSHILALVLGLL